MAVLSNFRPIVFEHLSALLSASTQYSILLIERAVVCLLRLCQILAQKVSKFLSSFLSYLPDCIKRSSRDQVYIAFDLLAGLPPSISNLVGEQVIAGLILVIEKNRDIVRCAAEILGRTPGLNIIPQLPN